MAPSGVPAVFLDRDGVLNIDHDFVHRPDEWDWVPGAPEALRRLKALGYLLIVVTNQSGVGRGRYTRNDVEALHRWANAELGGLIDAFYYCPHVDADQCMCRKPAPGMLLQAVEEHGIDLGNSFLIGDNERDILAAQAAGVRGYRFQAGNLDDFVARILNGNVG